MTENDKQLYQLTQGITRIANYMEEILKLVKQDMERMKKINEEPEEGDMRDHFKKAVVNEKS